MTDVLTHPGFCNRTHHDTPAGDAVWHTDQVTVIGSGSDKVHVSMEQFDGQPAPQIVVAGRNLDEDQAEALIDALTARLHVLRSSR